MKCLKMTINSNFKGGLSVEIKETVWVIMTKDGKKIAKGVPRNRHLIDVDDKTDKKRILTYGSKAKAEAGFTVSGFYGGYDYCKDDYEVVEAEFIIKTKQ